MRLIDADELLEAIDNQDNWLGQMDISQMVGINIYSLVNSMPTVERPHGKWIEHYDSSDGFTWLTCSRCMFKAYEEDYNFCPNCGADMRKEAENEDSN